ncbi:MAG: biosynthetic peptidoglycan transglycosylase, partial [Myxococcota bacterium]
MSVSKPPPRVRRDDRVDRRAHTARQARTARRLLIAIPVTFILGIAAIRITVNSVRVRRAVALRTAEAIANQTRGSVQLSGVTFDWTLAPCFQNLQIYTIQGPFRFEIVTPQACVERWFSALGSGFVAVRVRLTTPSIQISSSGFDGEDAPFVNVRPDSETSTATQGRPILRELTVVFDDLRLQWNGLPVPDRLSRGDFGPIDGRIMVQKRGALAAATIAIRDRDSQTRFDGRVTPTSSGWDLSAGIEGDVVRIFGSILRTFDLDVRKMPCRGRVGAIYADHQLTLDLDLEQYDVDFASELVSSGRLVGLDARQRFRMMADLDRGTVELGSGLVEINGVPVDVALQMTPQTKGTAFAGQLDLRTMSMARLLRSVPGSVAPVVVQNIDPAVRFALSFELNGLLSNVATWQPKLEHRLVGVSAQTNTGLEFLERPFPYRPLTAKGRANDVILRGPKTEGWLRYRRIPYLQRRAIIISEDATFPFHRGVDLEEVKDALAASLRRQRRVRGGSTLTQQLVKNLFLTRDRTALRKVVELLLTFHIESVLSKEQIFELYTNLIEWGPQVHGLHAAAQHYFGRTPHRLKPLEMIYL